MTHTTLSRITFNNTFANSIRFRIADFIAPELSDILHKCIIVNNTIAIEDDSENLTELYKKAENLEIKAEAIIAKTPKFIYNFVQSTFLRGTILI